MAIKLPKEAILSARENQGFNIYLVRVGQRSCLGLVTAFLDDRDEPITIRTPLGDGDELTADVLRLLSQDSFEVYFFDEQSRELLGQVAAVSELERFRRTSGTLCFPRLSIDNAVETHQAMVQWFGGRTKADDQAAFDVRFLEPLYSDELLRIDIGETPMRGIKVAELTSIERNDPAAPQEQDIARLLQRVFPWEAVILNPIRADTKRELCDVLVVMPGSILAVQAKDSPNTAVSLQRSIFRKLATSLAHLEKATAQLRGALKHLRTEKVLELELLDGPISIPMGKRELRGMVVLNEMFDDHFREYSEPVLRLADEIRVPTIVMDYPALHIVALRLDDPDRFLGALDDIYSIGVANGEFPRSQYLGPPRG